jgi:hypothetical protein
MAILCRRIVFSMYLIHTEAAIVSWEREDSALQDFLICFIQHRAKLVVTRSGFNRFKMYDPFFYYISQLIKEVFIRRIFVNSIDCVCEFFVTYCGSQPFLKISSTKMEPNGLYTNML